MRESHMALKRTTLQTFNKFYQTESDYRRPVWKGDINRFVYPNLSQIMFMGEGFDHDKEMFKLRGVEPNGAFLDEANELQESTFDIIVSRVMAMSNIIHPQPKPIIIMTANPSHSWLKRRIYDPWKNGELPDYIAYVPAKITDNPYVPKQAIEDLKRTLPPKYFRMMVEGDWEVTLVDCPFIEIAHDNYVKPCKKINNQSKYILSFDFNVNPATCLVAEYFQGKLYVVKEYFMPNTSLPRLCEEIRKDLRPEQIIYVCGDAAGHARIAGSENLSTNYEIIANHLNISYLDVIVAPKSNPLIFSSQIHVNTQLALQKIYIDPSCKELLQDMISCQLVDAGSGDSSRVKIFHNDKMRGHLLDCFRYLVHFVFN